MTDIQQLPAGLALDRMVCKAFPELTDCNIFDLPSELLNSAFMVLEVLRERGWVADIVINQSSVWVTVRQAGAFGGYEARSDSSMPTGPATALAICRAALQAREQEKQNGG